MKGREVGYVLLALIILGVAGVIVKLVTTGNNDQTLTGLLPLHSDVIDEVTIRTTEFGPDSTEGTAKLSRLGEDWSIKTEFYIIPWYSVKGVQIKWPQITMFCGKVAWVHII